MRILKMIGCAVLCTAILFGCAPAASQGEVREDFTTGPAAQPQSPEPVEVASGELSYRAMWFGYPDWPLLDTSSETAFTASVGTMLDNCVSLGLNTVIVHVRPFADAIYPSEYFPFSHLLAGTQGQDPGYDALAIFVQQAHDRGLIFEAWINPYRVTLTDAMPGSIAENNLVNTHPDWVKQVDAGLYLDPASEEVQNYIVAGVEEILENYDVDGIQFDDYFYATTLETFDAQEYAAAQTNLSLNDWRRENVNHLVQKVYTAVKAKRPEVTFGISPQGNNDNNYNGQYSDVKLWLSTPGYVDYIMPQVYWGYDFTLSNGSTRFAYENIINEWMAMPRNEAVSLYFGLGAYRIGDGDGSESDEWESGHNLADMAGTLMQKQSGGYALYCYRYLFANETYSDLANAECEALLQRNAQA